MPAVRKLKETLEEMNIVTYVREYVQQLISKLDFSLNKNVTSLSRKLKS